jgi:hypothetical protein
MICTALGEHWQYSVSPDWGLSLVESASREVDARLTDSRMPAAIPSTVNSNAILIGNPKKFCVHSAKTVISRSPYPVVNVV